MSRQKKTINILQIQESTKFEVKKLNGHYYKFAYKHYFPITLEDWEIELKCAFKLKLSEKDGGLGAYNHFIKAKNFLLPSLSNTNNYWMKRIFNAFVISGTELYTLCGGAGTGKTTHSAILGILWYLENPAEKALIVSSTELHSAEQRIWGVVVDFMTSLSIDYGEIVKYKKSPPPCYKYQYVNKFGKVAESGKHGIFLKPLKKGTAKQIENSLKGFHPKTGLFFIVDEMDAVSTNVIDVIPNLRRSIDEFKFFGIANPNTRDDAHGLLTEPLDGWDSVDPWTFTNDDDAWWFTKRGNMSLMFPSYHSPAIKIREEEGDAYDGRFDFFITQEEIDTAKEQYGEKSSHYMQYVLGFFPDSTGQKNMIDAVTVYKAGADKKAHFSGTSRVEMLAALDPAFTADGDEIILRFAKLGTDTEGKKVLDFGGKEYIHSLQLPAKLQENKYDWIAKNTMQLLEKMNVKNGNFALDSNAGGDALLEIFKHGYGLDVYSIISQGPASDRLVFSAQDITAKKLYANKVTELWFMVEKFIRASQIKGLDRHTIEELTRRLYEGGAKVKIESKRDFKIRVGGMGSAMGSPDRADCCTYIVDLARSRHDFLVTGFEDDEDELLTSWERQQFILKKRFQQEQESYFLDDEEEDSYLSGIFSDDEFSSSSEEFESTFGSPSDFDFDTD